MSLIGTARVRASILTTMVSRSLTNVLTFGLLGNNEEVFSHIKIVCPIGTIHANKIGEVSDM